MKTLIGVTSWGNLPFLELCLRSFQETITRSDVEILVVVARPDDSEMRNWLDQRGFKYIQHSENKGFAGSINDILDYAFVDGDFEAVIIAGNDIVAMPGAIDTMIARAETEQEYDLFCASEFNSRFLVTNYPEVRDFFKGESLIFEDFASRPWEVHKDFRENTLEPDTLKDVRNLTLYRRRAFEVVGYADVGFFPNAYWEDNDMARRCHLLNVRACGLPSASFFHFWSRSIWQGEGRAHNKFYTRNQDWYEQKWGTRVWGQERFSLPFDGVLRILPNGAVVKPTLEIPDRDEESRIISYWKSLP